MSANVITGLSDCSLLYGGTDLEVKLAGHLSLSAIASLYKVGSTLEGKLVKVLKREEPVATATRYKAILVCWRDDS